MIMKKNLLTQFWKQNYQRQAARTDQSPTKAGRLITDNIKKKNNDSVTRRSVLRLAFSAWLNEGDDWNTHSYIYVIGRLHMT